MRLITCETMRDGILVALAFLGIGVVLIYAAANFLSDVASLRLVASVLGIVSLFFAPIILISTFIATVWPGSRKKMDSCEH
jgi:hypothetical protein